MRPLAFSLATLITVSVAPSAFAQTRQGDDSYIYNFTDDYMVGDTISTMTAIIKVRPSALRATWIRPRASFVAEMLKSVEAL